MAGKKNHHKHAVKHMELAAHHHAKAKEHMSMVHEAKEEKLIGKLAKVNKLEVKKEKPKSKKSK